MNLYQKAVHKIVKLCMRRFPGKYNYAKLRKDARRISKMANIFIGEVNSNEML
ncbi:hypothetical protein ACTFJW_17090 [Clostridium cagae]|uniref:hypothetical protein n=1 Tax=Clostridium cagae TaxID=2080751 RepID=UPI003F76A1D2